LRFACLHLPKRSPPLALLGAWIAVCLTAGCPERDVVLVGLDGHGTAPTSGLADTRLSEDLSGLLSRGPAGRYHQVVRGDTLYGLARRFGLGPAEIAADNGLRFDARLRIGQWIFLRGPRSAVGPETRNP